jgi:DNA-binding CsgD family transcriptional regulator/tetratricopeptide (TPR) repeat protein
MVESQPQANEAYRSGSPAQSTFVGRQREMAELTDALVDAISGQGRIVMLAGEPGIGKTRTAQELRAYAESLDVRVLWGWCYEEEGAPPYWPWVQSLGSYIQQRDSEQLRFQMGPGAADIAEIIPEVRSKLPDLQSPPALDSPQAARFRLFDSITTFLKNASQEQPLMLVLDDLHWADKPSLLLLQFLARQLAESPLLLVGCYRDVEISRQHPLSDTLAQLAREPVFQRQLLQGLDEEDTRRFIESEALIRPSPEVVETIYAQTEGNPLFMREVVRLLREQRELVMNEIRSRQGIKVPMGIREAVGQRLNRRSEQCNRTLTTASVIGREFSLHLIAHLMEDLSEENLLEVLEEALTAGVIEELPGPVERYQFAHALIQDTLVSELSAARRARLHARIGEALEELYGANAEVHAGELAYHFAGAATVLGPEKLVRYSLLAGDRALVTYAPEEALHHFQRGWAAKESQPMNAESAALLLGLGRAQAATAQRPQWQEVVACLSRAFDYYVEMGDVDRAVTVAEYPLGTALGSLPETSELIARALALVSPDSLEAGRLLVRHGWNLGRMKGDYQGAREVFGQALALALHQGDTDLEMQTAAAAAEVDLFHLRCQESLEKALRAIELARRADDPRILVQSHQRATLSLTILGDLERARRHADTGLAPAERLRDRFWLDSALWSKQFLYRLEGNWQASREISEQGLALSPAGPRNLADRVLLEYELGNFSQGETYLKRLVEIHHQTRPAPTTGYAIPAVIIPLVARIDPAVDGLDVARATAEVILSELSASPPLVIIVARAGLALLAVLEDNVHSAQEQYTALVSQRGTMLHTGVASIDRVLGLLMQTMGQPDEAAAHFEDALIFCRKAGARSEVAWTCYDYAETLLRRGGSSDRTRVMSLLDEALVITHDLGMVPLMERIQTLQEKVAVQAGSASIYPDGLTQREVEVLCLIAAGRRNPEIAAELVISLNTVTRHVSNIFSKTGAANRAEAATYAYRHGLVQ